MNRTLNDQADPSDDELLARLRSARPATPEALTSPTSATALALREEILMTTTSAVERIHPRVRRAALGAVGIAAATVAVTLVATGGPAASPGPKDRAGAPTSASVARTIDVADIELIAARSGEALARSGRAVVRFESDFGNETFLASAGTSRLAFSGDDIEMTVVFDGAGADSPEGDGFTAQNKTVGGEFYLLDGPVGARKWVHDTNAAGGRGTEIFTIDPRNLFSLMSADAGFRLVGTETVDGVSLRHLRSTNPVPAGSLDFGLGPVSEVDATADVVDIWVDDADLTRRVDLQLSYGTETIDPDLAPLLGKNPDGSITLTGKDGTVTVVPRGEPLPALPMTTRTVRSSYSVTFSDIGAPIVIEPPAEYTDIAGVG